MSNRDRNLVIIGLILLVFLVMIVVVAGGSGEPVENTTEFQNKDVSTDISDEIDLRGNYMDGCLEAGGNQEYCSCTWDELRKLYSEEEIAKKGLEFQQSGQLPAGFDQAISNCLDKIEY